ncbi:hypothetical protein [Cryobacterium sp. PH31-L1]|nr:hypothetical protein [Cryobacterium sp. PH31-L1]MDJ0376281.1 hypothetical protein [Cryobacterium sp. PH31-L1]
MIPQDEPRAVRNNFRFSYRGGPTGLMGDAKIVTEKIAIKAKKGILRGF